MDTRFSIHNATVQKLPPTQPRPRKKLSHVVKAQVSAPIDGAFAPIPTRREVKRKRRGIFRSL